MSRKLNQASAIAVAATMLTILASSEGSGAAAQATVVAPQTESTLEIVTPQVPEPQTVVADPELVAPDVPTPPATTLAKLVAQQPQPADLSRELNCLAGAIYFEAKSESLAGQLAVGRVVVARSKSGRFPNSYCGVVYQPSQFSFVRGNAMPAIPRASRQWKNAVAIAQIAHAGAWQSPVEGALFFHATHVSPNWRLRRMARVDNHVFYR